MPSSSLRDAVRLLRGGGIIAYPTEAVYGIGCDPDDDGALARILELKQRPIEKGLILVAAESSQLVPFLQELPSSVVGPALASWPGPNTWLWPARASVSRLLRGDHSTLAVRVSAHPIVRELCLAFGGPLVSTSANPSGSEPARSATEVHGFFGDDLDLVVSGELGPGSRPTQIRDLLTGAVLRSA